MKLAESNAVLERSASFKEASFDIGDPILIMEYLRKNAYSNPKRAICQEIMSNARDAHRELGLDLPIQVVLPNRMTPTWSCRDFGPGISPERMENVFIKFGRSTKRTDNTQTGGFGVGAKTPWAYTDTFIITTICNIEGHLIKYHYAAVIGENRVPKLIQMSDPCAATETHTGTTISFNVEARDQSDFVRYTHEVCRFWNPRPKIIGETADYAHLWAEINYQHTGDNWAIANDRHSGNTMVIIDGIPYALTFDSINDHLTDSERNLVRYSCCHFFFGVGELSVSLNREALYYDDRTIKMIVARIKSMVVALRSHFENEVSNSKTLWDAALNFRKAVGFFNHCDAFLTGIQWNGKTIPTKDIFPSRPAKVIRYERTAKDSYKWGGRVRRFTADCNIAFKDNAMLVHGDSKTRIEYMFSQKPDLKFVYAFYQEYSGVNEDAKWAEWYKQVTDLGAVMVDTLPKPPKVPREKRERKTVSYKTYEWNGHDWSDTEISEDDLINGEGIYVPCFRRQAMTDHTCAKPIGSADGCGGWDGLKVSDFLNVLSKKVKVYGIQKDLLGDLGDGWVTLYDYMWKQFSDTATALSVPIGAVVDAAKGNLSHGYRHATNLGKLIDANMDKMPKCIVAWHDATKIVQIVKDAGIFSYSMKHEVASFIKLHDIKGYKNLYEYYENVMETCKMLKNVNFCSYGYDASMDQHVVIYLEALKSKENLAIELVA
jgi:hypothetical protein